MSAETVETAETAAEAPKVPSGARALLTVEHFTMRFGGFEVAPVDAANAFIRLRVV